MVSRRHRLRLRSTGPGTPRPKGHQEFRVVHRDEQRKYGKVTGGVVFREGVWGENENPPKKWEIYPTITKPVEAASDHAAIYADLDL